MSVTRLRVRVPATTANLGPGFDALGLALGLWNEVTVEPDGSGRIRVDVHGSGRGRLPRDERHLVVRTMLDTLDRLGSRDRLDGARVIARNEVPQSGGLGSSASAVVAGVAAALWLHTGALPDRDELFRLASAAEGHPDNAAPAVYGGGTIAWQDDSGAHAVPIAVDPRVTPVILVPDYQVRTAETRRLLPERVPLADAVFDVSRAALLVRALEARPDLLPAATEDRLHQPYRAEAMRPTAELIGRLRGAGHAAVLSGAGPTVLVLAQSPVEADAVVAQAPARTAGAGGLEVRWRARRVAVARDGATVVA